MAFLFHTSTALVAAFSLLQSGIVSAAPFPPISAPFRPIPPPYRSALGLTNSSAPSNGSGYGFPAFGSGKTQMAGVNIAGFEFGCDTTGTCSSLENALPPTSEGQNNGTAQMAHFVTNDHMNVFRLPVSWQYLTNNALGGNLDATNMANYDSLMQGCLATGASCILDIHNYARVNNQIIGQGGPTNDDFNALWGALAKKYAKNDKVIFGIMNEPHNLNSLAAWAGTVQGAVKAIRAAGATTQIITLPGTNFASAASFISSGSAAALSNITDPAGGTSKLIFDVHQYLDSDKSGTHAECATGPEQLQASFAPLASWLRQNKRVAFLTETGGGDTASCFMNVCALAAILNSNADAFLGYVAWSGGSFDPSYVLSVAPKLNAGDSFTDTALMSKCFAR